MRIRKIYRNEMNHYVIDATFFADKYIPLSCLPTNSEKEKKIYAESQNSLKWWTEIELALKHKKARVYIPDICISETFRALARKRYDKDYSNRTYYYILNKIRKDLRTEDKNLAKKDRYIQYHDLPTTRDIIVSMDRFFKMFFKYGKGTSVPDILVVASAKYLMDFYSIPYKSIHIISSDGALVKGSKKISEIPTVYDPRMNSNSIDKIFLDNRK